MCGPKYNPDNQVYGDFHVAGMVVIILTFIVILVIGILAHRLKTGKWKLRTSEEQIVGQRNLGLVIGVMTMTGNNFSQKLPVLSCLEYNYIKLF